MIGVLHVDIEGGWGGSSRSLYELVRRLDRSKIAPIVAHRQMGPVSEWYRELEIPAYHVPEIGSFVPRHEKALKNFIASLPRLSHLDRAARRLCDIARQHRCRIIHLNYEGLFMLAPHLRQLCGLPMIAHSRTHLPKSIWGRWVARKLSRNVEHMFFISPQEENRWRELTDGRGAVGEVLWNISREPLAREPFVTPPEVIFLGNLERSKGPDRVIEVAAAIKQRGISPFVFSIYGRARTDRGYVDELGRLCRALGVESIVRFCGHVTEPEPVLARAFALLRLSYQNDPWGRDVIEASAAGLPVVATGTFEGVISNGVNGYLLSQFDAGLVADILLQLHRDQARWQSMSNAGQRIARDKFGGRQAERFAEVACALATRELSVVRSG